MIEYIIPESVEQIADKLYDRKAYFLAGGTDIMVMKKKGEIRDDLPWVDLSGLDVLRGITEEEGYINIGPLTTMSDIEKNAIIIEKAAALSEAAGRLGSPLIRNLATLGGNIANANPAGDTIPALNALDAVLILTKGDRTREVPVNEFCMGPCENILSGGEIITSIKIPVLADSFSGFLKLGARESLAISKISVAAWWIKEQKKIKDIRIAMGAVGPKCIRAKKTEELLKDEILSKEILEKAVETISYEACPIDDYRSTMEYRRRMTGVLLKRVLSRKPEQR
jgi:carbon-monoxide dehydrogenase medium subunit